MSEDSRPDKRPSLAGEISALLSLFAIYLFAAGWVCFYFYFKAFSLDPRSLNISLYAILVKGFHVVTGSCWSLAACIGLFIIMLLPDVTEQTHPKSGIWLRAVVATLATLFLIPVYFWSRDRGVEEASAAMADKTTTLPIVTFAVKNCQLVGRLVLQEGDTYFIHHVELNPSSGASDKCKDQVAGPVELSIYRAPELSNIKVTELKGQK